MGLLGQLQRLAAGFALQLLHLVPGGFVRQGPRMVRVVIRLGTHGQNRPRVHIHHNANAPGRHVVFLHGVAQVILQIVLDVCINGQGQGVPRHGRHVGVILNRRRVPPGIFQGEHLPAAAGQRLIVFQLQPRHALIVHIGKPENTPGEVSHGVHPLGILVQIDPLPTVGGTGIPHLVRQRFVHPAAQQGIVGGSLAQLFPHCFLVQVQNFRQRSTGRIHVLRFQFPRGGAHRPAGG